VRFAHQQRGQQLANGTFSILLRHAECMVALAPMVERWIVRVLRVFVRVDQCQELRVVRKAELMLRVTASRGVSRLVITSPMQVNGDKITVVKFLLVDNWSRVGFCNQRIDYHW